jgi:hypothetical protein
MNADELYEHEERIALTQEGSRNPDGSPMAIDEVRRDVLSGEIKPTEVRK